MIAILLLLLAANPPELVARDTVDLIEVNHFYDEHGKLVFDQIIFYDWAPDKSRFDVRAWRLLKHSQQLPLWNSERRIWESIWQDGDAFRHITSQIIRETWTQHDPELVERGHLPKEERRGLSPVLDSRRIERSILRR